MQSSNDQQPMAQNHSQALLQGNSSIETYAEGKRTPDTIEFQKYNNISTAHNKADGGATMVLNSSTLEQRLDKDGSSIAVSPTSQNAGLLNRDLF
jgi:hypothetical protein